MSCDRCIYYKGEIKDDNIPLPCVPCHIEGKPYNFLSKIEYWWKCFESVIIEWMEELGL
jgi:hypothetical protein